ncbi:MAG: hypothetical protein KKD44_21910 [Proteobacteria bacterium]|nr:hypothetical protein [Pseudomonadota bacterium]
MKNELIYTRILILLVLFTSSSCSFFGSEKRWKPVKQTRHAFVHTVEWPNESMPLISRWYTGKEENAEHVIKANPTVNPERLVVGTLIYIPRKLLKTREPMTREFVENSLEKPIKKIPAEPVKIMPEKKKIESPDKFELFGPR